METNFKNQQKATISQETGLTAQQERACIMLASGENATKVAELVGINRTTLYKWFKSDEFIWYYNELCREIKREVKSSVLSLHQSAVNTIKSLLESESESVRFKASTWVLENIAPMISKMERGLLLTHQT